MAPPMKSMAMKSMAVNKKSSGGIGDFFGSIGSSISNVVTSVFTRE